MWYPYLLTYLLILKAKEHPPTLPIPNLLHNLTTSSFTRSTPVSPPQVVSEMTHPQFRKFKIDWNVFKQITEIPHHQIAAQLYSLCDDSVQNTLSFINTVTDAVLRTTSVKS